MYLNEAIRANKVIYGNIIEKNYGLYKNISAL